MRRSGHIRIFFEDVEVVIMRWLFYAYWEGRVRQTCAGLSIIDLSRSLAWVDLLMLEKRSGQLQ